MTTTPFGVRLAESMATRGPLCVGIDPHPSLLQSWGMPVSAAGVETFTSVCLDALSGVVAAVKPQSAFFEEYGSAGIAVLEGALERLRGSGTLAILDVKRGDIGSTMGAYARAYLADDSPLRADAITLSPYLGFGSLHPAIELAESTGRGVFVLTLTSNPEGSSVQHAVGAAEGAAPGRSVAATVVDEATRLNAPARVAGQFGNVGLVVGATLQDAPSRLGLDFEGAAAPLLVPGLGAQGGSVSSIKTSFAAASRYVLATSSRAILAAGPDPDALRDAALAQAGQLRQLAQP